MNDTPDMIDYMERAILDTGRCETYPVDHALMGEVDGVKLYRRTAFVPAGFIFTTPTHLLDHAYFLMQGKLEIVYQDGSLVELSAPYMGQTPAGTRRAVKILEDVVWVTCHLTTKSEPEEILAEITGESKNSLITNEENQMLLNLRANSPQCLPGGAS